jgi:5-methylcytosine-specific restriction endonuclease McrA
MPSWEEKRDEILKRDNYTCQSCQIFNPSYGIVNVGEGLELQLHQYESFANADQSVYTISIPSGITIQISFGDCHLVLPVLQVHHKRYIEGRPLWDYDNSDLITLCKQCHTILHWKERVPVHDHNERFIEDRYFEPEDFTTGHRHNYRPWIFIQKSTVNGEYFVSDIHPKIHMVIFEHEDRDAIQQKAKEVLSKFIEKYLPDYKEGAQRNFA